MPMVLLYLALAAGPALSVDAFAVQQTTAPLTVFIAADGGSDLNDCLSPATACASVQAGVNRVPKNIYHPVTVQVAPGLYAGAYVEGFTVHPMIDAGAGYSSLWLNGTMVDFVPDAGTNAGVLTSASALDGVTFATLSDDTQTWAPDSLKGQFVEIVSGTGCCIDAGWNAIAGAPAIYPIVNNTSTTLTVLGLGTLAAADSGYRIEAPGSRFISVAATNQPTPSDLMWFNDRGAIFAVSRMGFDFSATNSRGISTTDARLNVIAVQMVGTSGSPIGISGQTLAAQTGASVRQSYFSWPTLFGVAVSYATTGGGPAYAGIVLIASAIDNGSIGFNSSSPSGATISNCSFRSQTFASIYTFSAGLMQIISSRFYGNASAIRTLESTVVGMSFSTFGLQNLDISNSTGAALSLIGPYSSVDMQNVSGSGNAIGLSISRGARAVVGGAVTLTGTTEVSIDGAASSWATMRSTTPKVISNPNYFTAFYE